MSDYEKQILEEERMRLAVVLRSLRNTRLQLLSEIGVNHADAMERIAWAMQYVDLAVEKLSVSSPSR